MEACVLDALRCALVEEPELWRFGLLSPVQLAQFSRDRGVQLGHDAVESLWRSGLLRCDVLAAEEELKHRFLKLAAKEENGRLLYCDMRRVVRRPEGYGGIFAAERLDETPGELLFHPFRIYVLYHIVRVFGFTPMSTQYLQYPKGLANLSNTHVEVLDKGTSTASFAERLEHWNAVAELAVVTEPISYGQVFLEDRLLPDRMQAKFAATEDAYGKAVTDVLSRISGEGIEGARSELVQAAELLDPNKLVHVLLRLTAKHERLKLRGKLGGSMLLLCMAESVRRAVERLLATELPEEDELGFAQWMDGARSLLYGTERILDASPETQRDFLTSMGLDRGVKARCYVEGPTELGALRSAVGEGGGIQFVNLRGQVLEKQGKGLSFVESLKGDRGSGIFSVVVLDGDREDYVRALRKVAREDTFFGVFTISTPDFEFSNFTAEELLSVWLEFSSRDTEEKPDMPDEVTPLEEVASAEQFTDYLCRSNFPAFEKSETWGEALMAYALENEGLPDGHARAGEIRPIVLLARQLMTARHAGYERSIAQFRVDADTGGLIRRDA